MGKAGRPKGRKNSITKVKLQEYGAELSNLAAVILSEAQAPKTRLIDRVRAFEALAPYIALKANEAPTGEQLTPDELRGVAKILATAMVSNPGKGVESPGSEGLPPEPDPLSDGPRGPEVVQDGDSQAKACC